MKRFPHPINSALRIAGLSMMLVILAGCGDKDSSQPHAQSASNEQGQAAPPPASAPSGTAQTQPQTPAQLPSYAPTADEVRQVFHNLLVQKAITLQPGEERDRWFMDESQRIKSMQVGKCTVAEVGTPSKCFISISEKTVELDLLLTQSGWIIVG